MTARDRRTPYGDLLKRMTVPGQNNPRDLVQAILLFLSTRVLLQYTNDGYVFNDPVLFQAPRPEFVVHQCPVRFPHSTVAVQFPGCRLRGLRIGNGLC